jgi:hypothetical protein
MNIDTALKGKKISGFEGFNLSSIVFSLSEHDRVSNEIYQKSFIILILKCFLDSHKWFLKKGTSKILFFNDSTRKQNKKMVDDLSKIVKDRNSIYREGVKNFNIKDGLKVLNLLFIWKKELKNTPLSMNQKKMVLNLLIGLKKYDYFLEKSILGKINLLVVFYDANSWGNFMVQKYRNKGILTSTLSHGIVLAEKDTNILDYSGVELKGFSSDYFLAWNNFTLSEAKKQHIDINKFKVLGVPHFVNFNKKACRIKNKTFGVIFENRSGDEFNVKILNYAKEISKELDYNFVVRYHPTFVGNEYDYLIKDCSNYIGVDKSNTIFEYSNSVEFSIVANSTVFIELIYMEHLIYRYKSNDIYDKFRELDYNSFYNFKDLKEMVSTKKDESKELFNLLCTVKDVKKSYNDFFRTFES